MCVRRGAQLFFYLAAEEREKKVSRLLTWPLGCRGQQLVVKLVLHSNYVKYGFSFFDLFSSQPRNLGSLNHASLRNDLYFDTNIICFALSFFVMYITVIRWS